MHIPDGLLDPVTTIVLWIVTIAVIVIGFFRMGKVFEEEDSEKLIPYIGVLAATIFAFQFVNYPVPGGTSGHLVGGTLVGVILGPYAAVIVMFMILIVQSLFGDGGITALGANTFNMGIIGGIVGFYIVKVILFGLNKTKMDKGVRVSLATAIGSYIAIVLAAFIAGIEIAIGGVIPFAVVVPAMIFWHVLIGIGEAIISGLIVLFIYKVKPELITTEKMLGVD
ncbi:MAG: cobalamin biosynthesis protein CbiM [Candidatus Lokiarchaeota archaeon]|nr:cobalamin biosynthesis protein CbiM [Candidatus Lokiarchaeota archaeon]MBD3341739.1 cobalamin biosynthesis protein CbiM [Candidatus Lokiarchaeota archaeon]